MCLLVFSLAPDGTLILAANRDEFWSRATAPAAFWPEDPEVLAGRDLAADGTWLGVRRGGRVAALTNFRDPAAHDPSRRSRGELVSGFLLARGETVEGWAADVAARSRDYNPFHLLLGDAAALVVVSGRTGTVRRLPPGLHAISNGELDEPWPKMRRSREALEALLASGPAEEESLFAMLRDTERAPDEALPATGVELEWERVLSAPFIVTPAYGTRSSTLVLRAPDGGLRFAERTFAPDGRAVETRRFAL